MMLNMLILWTLYALIAAGGAFAARKIFKLSRGWTVAVGAVVFVGLLLIPTETHIVRLEMPKSSN